MKKRKVSVRGFNLFEVSIIIVISCVISIIIVGTVISNNYRTNFGVTYRDLLNDENIKDFLNVYSEVSSDYYKDVDKAKVIDSAINGMMSYLGDKYSSYLDSYDSKQLNDKLSGTYKGIGISVDKNGKIVDVIEGTPAFKEGLEKGDIIKSINGTNIDNNNVSSISTFVKENDQFADITVSRNNELLNFKINIEDIISSSIASTIIEKNEKRIGYIYIETFSNTLGTQIENALNKLNNINGLIIDVRNNGGGYLKAASDTASLFLEKGKVIYSLENKNDTNVYKDETDQSTSYPIVVLIDGGSASASEILTGALKDSYNAIIVGNKSYGKGLVQVTYKMDDGSMVKYSSAKWLRPNGECVEGNGIEPDYVVNNDNKTDNQINKAIELLSNM